MSRFFHGRAAELERLRGLVSEPVAVICGLAGIGKTELAFRAVDALLEVPGWSDVPVVRVIAVPEKQPNFHAHLLARLTGEGSVTPLDRLVDVLAHERMILTIDDGHHALAELGVLVDALERRSIASRVIVTSRVELPVATAPLVVRLGPLIPAEARELARHLAARLGVAVDDFDEVAERAAGSPLALRHLIAGGRSAAGLDPVQSTLASLDSEARRCLIQLASVSACSQSRLAASTLVPDERVLQALKEHCLVDCGPDRVVVHGLIRDLVMPLADSRLVLESRRAVAGALWEQFQQHHRPLCAVEAICLTVSVGEVEQALARMLAASRTIASAGLDPLLLPILERLAAAGHTEAALFVARIYLRMARIEDAAGVLEGVATGGDDPRVLLLRASIAERVCDLPAASAAFSQAIAHTPAGRLRCLLSMRLAVVEALGGKDDAAYALLRAVELECETMSDVDTARMWWVRSIIHALHQDWGHVKLAVASGRAAAVRGGAHDLDFLLMLLDLLAASEEGNIARSAELAEEVSRALPSQPVRERMTDLYLGVSHLARNQVEAAVETLARAYDELGRRRDTLLSSLAGHYLGRALLMRGDARGAETVLGEVASRAAACGLVPLIGSGRAVFARALVSSGRVTEARQVAAAMTADADPRVAAEAESVMAYAAGFGGDLGTARRHLARALAHAGDRDLVRLNLILDEAQVEMLGGDPDRVQAAAQEVLRDDVRRSRPYARGRALIAMAAANLASGDVGAALGELAEAEQIATAYGLNQLLERTALIRNATVLARGARLDHIPAEHRPGILGLLRLLGLRSETIVVSTRGGRIHIDPARLAGLAQAHDVLVEVASGTLLGRSGKRVEGRGTGSAIMVALAESPEPLPPERLYQLVWGSGEYHPLRHRNTLYIALNRTRKLLREVGEEREVIHRDTTGWSISPEIDLAIARRDPRLTSTSSRVDAAVVKTK